MFGRPFDEISLADLQGLVENGIPEGRQLEFKRDRYAGNDAAKKEFAADVSAFANAQGGILLVGVEEKNGIASGIAGVEVSDSDAFVRGISDFVRSSIEPQILDLRVRWIPLESGRGVLMIRVGRSWNAPHRVTVAGDSKFFMRDENGKHPMSVSELRSAFIFASEVEERIRRFRTERLTVIEENEGPLAIDKSNPTLVLHLVPQAAFSDRIHIDIENQETGIRPLGESSWNKMYSLNGLVSYSGPEERFETVRAFSTLFRDGPAEAVARIHAGEFQGRPTLNLGGVEEDVIKGAENILSRYAQLSISPPFYVMLSLFGVRDLCAPVDRWRHYELAYPHRADKVILPELTIDDANSKASASAILRPIFDLMWNAFGVRRSPNYDDDGTYRT